jgi:hypothetical protein
LKEIVPDGVCGYTVAPEPQEIAEKLTRYFIEEKEPAFTENVKKEKKKYEWGAFIHELLRLYVAAKPHDR